MSRKKKQTWLGLPGSSYPLITAKRPTSFLGLLAFIEVTELFTFDCVAKKTGEGRLQKGLFYTIVQERGEHGLLLEHLTRGFFKGGENLSTYRIIFKKKNEPNQIAKST